MVLFSSFQNLNLASINRNAIIAIRNRNPPLGANPYKKLVQTNGIDHNQRITNFVNPGRQNNILTTALQTHNGSLIYPDNLEISIFRFNEIIGVAVVERVDSLKTVEKREQVVAWTVDFSASAFRGLVDYESEMVVFYLEFTQRP